MERNLRTTLQGVVISTKMAKTIVVEVETHKKHAKYAKRIKYSNRYYAHDEKEIANEGDVVTIMGCRPLSATKRFRLVSVDKKAVSTMKVEEATAKLEEKDIAKAEEKVEEQVTKKPVAKKAVAKKTTTKKATEEKTE